jgi:hypothetical protein
VMMYYSNPRRNEGSSIIFQFHTEMARCGEEG